jgi:signal transduction histidine kinase
VLALGLDRSTLAEINDAGWGAFSHGWARDADQIIRLPLDVNALLPWVLKRVRAGETVIMPSLDDLPDEAAVDRESYRRYGTKSNIIFPIRAGGEVVGGVSFATMYREQKWTPAIVEQLQLVAEIFGYALERKKSVGEIRLLREELTHVTRITTVGELAASIAHDLNQPLTAIMNDAEAARLFLAPDRPNLEAARTALKEIISEDKRASEIIGRFRSLFKRRELRKSMLFADDLFSDVERIMKSRAIMNNISLTFHMAPSLPSIAADPILLQQVLINLIVNAFDSIRAVAEGLREVEVSAFSGEPGFINFTVRDSGIGVDKKLISRLFQSFVTTKPQGLGMGLAIARSIVTAHGGQLWARRNLDSGACFEFTLPTGNGGNTTV